MSGTDILDFNNKIYDYLIKNPSFKSASIEKKIRSLRAVSMFCSSCHTGRYNSSFCNKKISEISSCFPVRSKQGDDFENNLVLFISTSLHVTGGHTRLMEQIALQEKDKGKKVVLFITEQVVKQLPIRIRNSDIFSEIVCYGNFKRTECVNTLRKWISNCSKVYNNQDPHDPVPPIALNYTNRPNTIYLNHADHVFWLGAQQCDTILNIRPHGEKLTRRRRSGIVPTLILPIRIETKPISISKQEARKKLQVDQHARVFLTISTYYKLIPVAEHNLFAVIDEITSYSSHVVFFLVGINIEQYTLLSGKQPSAQVRVLGEVEDPSIIKAAADFYIEGMPVNSLTALLEGIYAGAYPFLMWKPYYTCVTSEDELCLEGLVFHPSNKQQYLNNIRAAVENELTDEYSEIVKQVQARIFHFSSNEYWGSILEEENTKPVNETEGFEEFSQSEEDISLAELLYNSRTETRPIEYHILGILYSSLTYQEYFRLSGFIYELLKRRSVYLASTHQVVKKIVKETMPFVVKRYSKRFT